MKEHCSLHLPAVLDFSLVLQLQCASVHRKQKGSILMCYGPNAVHEQKGRHIRARNSKNRANEMNCSSECSVVVVAGIHFHVLFICGQSSARVTG